VGPERLEQYHAGARLGREERRVGRDRNYIPSGPLLFEDFDCQVGGRDSEDYDGSTFDALAHVFGVVLMPLQLHCGS
jgi:hypothetical protein